MGGSGYTRPAWARRLVALGAGVGGAESLVGLDVEELVATACRTTGLHDFGAPTWEEPFRRLVDALDGEARLHALGRLLCRADLLRHLQTRLRVVDALRREPSIAEERIDAPIVITGPARSGTSILHELLAEDPNLRAPLAWEMAHPFPPAGGADERADWAEAEYDLWGDIQPEFLAVHELASRLPEECLWLLAPEFDMGFWSTCTEVPSFLAWRAGTDPAPAYRMHRTMLQVLQAGTEPKPWALKSPVHLGRLPALLAEYPDARIILTHRDPVRTIPSAVSTLTAGRWLRSDAVDRRAIAAGVGFGFPLLLNGLAAGRDALPAAQVAHVHYLDLLRDPVGTIRSAYEHLGLEFGPDLPARIEGYLAGRKQDKYGVHRYPVADTGLDLDQVREQCRPYTEAFGVEAEDPPA